MTNTSAAAPRDDSDGEGLSELVLKTTPPRVSHHMLTRPRLQLDTPALRASPVLIVQSAAGDGKTALLTQWRRDLLAEGCACIWLLADDSDEPQRFVRALRQAVRTGCALPGFGRSAGERAITPLDALDAMTEWLAAVAAVPGQLMLMIDEADRLPPASAKLLSYVLHNAPSNLRVALATRTSLAALVKDLLVYGHCVTVSADLLRFTALETCQLLSLRFGGAAGTDAPGLAAQLQELSQGWALGLQLAMAAADDADSLPAALTILAVQAQAPLQLTEPAISMLLARLDRQDAQFLISSALTYGLHPQLCASVAGLPAAADAALRLANLAREFPVFITAEDGAWSRLQEPVRAALRQRLAGRSETQRNAMHWRAARWLADQGLLSQAASHALAANDTTLAFNLVERCLLLAVRQGDAQALEQWRSLLPEAELAARPRLALAAAWMQAISVDHRQCEARIEGILAAAGDDTALQYECMLVACVAAIVADQCDRFVAMFTPWVHKPPPSSDPWLRQAHANRTASWHLRQGNPAAARRHLQQQHAVPIDDSSYVRRWSEFLIAHSYRWEGQVRLAQETAVPLVLRADADLGRRHPLSVMFAALLANIAFDSGAIEEAAGLVADRLDVLGRAGAPDSVISGFRTAARSAFLLGEEHRAMALLDEMLVVGDSRKLPRVSANALAEKLRLHAVRHRGHSASSLLPRLDALAALGRDEAPIDQRALQLPCHFGHAFAAVARKDWQQAQHWFARVEGATTVLHMGRLGIETMAMQALVRRQLDVADARAGEDLLLEARNLAVMFGMQRAVQDSHPMVADWLEAIDGPGQRLAQVVAPAAPRVMPNELLTRKENEVLALLANNLSNKEIASALMVGEETVKWHMKNLFGKLDAASRKHVVRRARLLGLLEGA